MKLLSLSSFHKICFSEVQFWKHPERCFYRLWDQTFGISSKFSDFKNSNSTIFQNWKLKLWKIQILKIFKIKHFNFEIWRFKFFGKQKKYGKKLEWISNPLMKKFLKNQSFVYIQFKFTQICIFLFLNWFFWIFIKIRKI
jgi:hypothetical protein